GVAAAEADFYPNVNLTAFAGLQSIGLSQLLQASDRIVGAGPALHLPVFNRGAVRGALQSQQAQLDASIGQYNQTLLDAVREVADVIANWRSLERESHEQQIALEAAQRSYDLTTERSPVARLMRQRRRTWLAALTVAVLVVALLASAWWWLYASRYQDTDDAYVAGDLVTVMPQVSGTVVAIDADETDLVHTGQELVRLDATDARIALEDAAQQLAGTVR